MVRLAIVISLVLALALLKPLGVVQCEALLNYADKEASLIIRSTKLHGELKLDGRGAARQLARSREDHGAGSEDRDEGRDGPGTSRHRAPPLW